MYRFFIFCLFVSVVNQGDTRQHSNTLLKSTGRLARLVKVFDLRDQYGYPINTFYSPLCLQMMLAVLYFATNGKTSEEIRLGANLPKSDKLMKEGFQQFISILGKTRTGMVKTSNGLFLDHRARPNDDFLVMVRKYFSTFFLSVSFSKHSQLLLTDWVKKQMHPYVHPLTPPHIVKFLAVNTLFFNQRWMIPFAATSIQSGVFYNYDGRNSIANYMIRIGKFKWNIDNTLGAKIVAIPFSRNEYEMVIIVPFNKRRINEFEVKAVKGLEWDPHKRLYIKLVLPEFVIQNQFNLKRGLERIGIQTVFTSNADFSRMTKARTSLQNVVQKSLLMVKSKKVTAGSDMAGGMNVEKLPVLVINQPFVYVIYHVETKTAMFIGRVTNFARRSPYNSFPFW